MWPLSTGYLTSGEDYHTQECAKYSWIEVKEYKTDTNISERMFGARMLAANNIVGQYFLHCCQGQHELAAQ